jgi:hypothetical protein
VAQTPAVVDVDVHVVQGNGGWRFAGPGEEEFQVVGMVAARGLLHRSHLSNRSANGSTDMGAISTKASSRSSTIPTSQKC